MCVCLTHMRRVADHEVSRATSFSGSWCDEADAAVDAAVAAGARLLADYRGHNCH